jgi:SAM-dependent methyltransferase
MTMEPPIDTIYQRGSHYDCLFDTAVPPFWLEQARRYGGPILELGCGTGRLAIPLAKIGCAVTGIDRAPSMLAEARRKAEVAGVTVTWHEADMREFDLGTRFAWAFIAANTLCHLLTTSDFEACIACVRKHLLPEGRLFVEVFVPKLEMLLQSPEERRLFSEYDDPEGGGRVVIWESSVYDPATQIKHNQLHYRRPGRSSEELGTLPMRIFFPQELDALFRYNGFVIEAKYGGLDCRSFDASSTTQVFALRLRTP